MILVFSNLLHSVLEPDSKSPLLQMSHNLVQHMSNIIPYMNIFLIHVIHLSMERILEFQCRLAH